MKTISRIIALLIVMACNSWTHGQVEMNLFGRWFDTTLVASSAHNNTYNEIWGYAQAGKEYAIIGSTAGTHIIDVTDPAKPTPLHLIPGGSVGSIIIHRDYHTVGKYLYGVADEGGSSTLQIIDLSGLPDSYEVLYDSQELIRRAHNIYIDTTTLRLYALLTANSAQGRVALGVYDISDPINPTVLARLNNIGGVSINHVHDAYIENNLAFLNCGGDGFILADLTDLDNIIVHSSLATFDYPQGGYNHSGWATEDFQYYYMADENHGFDMKVMDVSNLDEIKILGTFNAESNSAFSIPHNLIVKGNRLYVSYYFDGLQVYDISDPTSPRRIGYYPTSVEPHRSGFYRGAWGVYPFLPSGNVLVSDMQRGLFVVQDLNLVDVDNIAESPSVKIYPNPTSELLMIQAAQEVEMVNLINMNGEKLPLHVEGGKANVSHLANGLYVLEVAVGSGVTLHQIVIQH